MIKYNIHENGAVTSHYSDDQGAVEQMLSLARNVAIESLKESDKSHAIYGVKFYDPVHLLPNIVDIYCPPVLLDDEEFTERTDAQLKFYPDSYVLSVHAKK